VYPEVGQPLTNPIAHLTLNRPNTGALDLSNVAVTRWSARLTDPQCEREYRLDRFPADRRRVLLLMGLMAIAGCLNLLLEYHSFERDFSSAYSLIAALATICLPLLGLRVMASIRSPAMLEALVVAGTLFGMATRLSQLTLHPDLIDIWSTLMVGFVFVIFLYLPIRLSIAVALAAGISCTASAWWLLTQGDTQNFDLFYRGLICVLVVNTICFIAANNLHRSQRMQFAQRLVLQQLLSTDAMTGIANRRRFDAALEREWRRCLRAGAPMSLLMIDVDHFKAYNDHCGHPRGDACLRQVARLLVEAVGRPGDLAARYGGEEFVCLLPEISAAGALAVANRLAAALRQADIGHPRSPAGPRLTVSIGVATAKILTGSPERLVEFADQLLYAAKDAGRNQIKVGHLTAEPESCAA
jgi:diguanylate cyclase (GGDEF)-like protein